MSVHIVNTFMFFCVLETGNKAVPNASTKSGLGRGCSPMLGTGNFQFPGNAIRELRPLCFTTLKVHMLPLMALQVTILHRGLSIVLYSDDVTVLASYASHL